MTRVWLEIAGVCPPAATEILADLDVLLRMANGGLP
jgi:hypothetical protein